MTLQYLDFDCVQDGEDTATFEAMASVWPEQVAAVQAEMAQVLDWAHQAFAGLCGPVGEGYDWDYDLHSLQELSIPETMDYDRLTRRFTVRRGAPGRARHTVTLSVSGTQEFCAAFRQRFGLE